MHCDVLDPRLIVAALGVVVAAAAHARPVPTQLRAIRWWVTALAVIGAPSLVVISLPVGCPTDADGSAPVRRFRAVDRSFEVRAIMVDGTSGLELSTAGWRSGADVAAAICVGLDTDADQPIVAVRDHCDLTNVASLPIDSAGAATVQLPRPPGVTTKAGPVRCDATKPCTVVLVDYYEGTWTAATLPPA